jgi:NADP-dependent 3-hydroxy acid dehydrogenase YdfG
MKPLIVITGASSGIGAELARTFSQAGYKLALLARNLHLMEKMQLPMALCLPIDVTDYDSLRKAIEKAEEEFGPVDCLINNASVWKSGEFTELSHGDHDKAVQTNLMGVINGIESVLPGMRKRKTGTIINVSSVADRYPRPSLATYAATKAAVKSLTDSLRMANSKFGIRLCNFAPAKVRTPSLDVSSLQEEETIYSALDAKIILWVYQLPQRICIRDMVVASTYYEPVHI